MPSGSATTPTTKSTGCSSNNCFSIPLTTEVGTEKFNLLDYPYGKSQLLSGSRIYTTAPECNDPSCELIDAKADGIFESQLWGYDGSAGYKDFTGTDSLDPWLGC